MTREEFPRICRRATDAIARFGTTRFTTLVEFHERLRAGDVPPPAELRWMLRRMEVDLAQMLSAIDQFEAAERDAPRSGTAADTLTPEELS